jgi:site-specific DNA-methyltransferase (cytosine-N4-specific)
MTRMIWLGMDQPKFKREEIGSHRKYSAKGVSGATAETFRTEMQTIFSWLHVHLKDGGFACFVVGDSTIRGERVNNADLIASAGLAEGFTEIARPTRRLQMTKKAFNPVIGKIKDEKIIILQKKEGPS